MIDANTAMAIAVNELHLDKELLEICEIPSRSWCIYNEPKEECWYIYVHQKEAIFLQSSTIIFISKYSGKILYFGSANDEG